MFKWFKNKKKDNKGFTLVELVIVIAILAILVGLLAPQYTKYVEKSRKAADASNMDEMVKVIKVYAADPASELAMDTYTITIGTNGTTLKNTTTQITNTTGGLGKEMESSIPNWEKTTVKSKKWGTGGKAASIIAKVEVKKDGGTAVSYASSTTGNTNNADDTNSKFKTYMETGSEKTQP